MQIFSKLIEAYNRIAPLHEFDKTPTVPIIIFEALILLLTIAALVILSRYVKRLFLRFSIVAMGIFIFEFFTSPMWNNLHMGRWAYIYHDISWIFTVGWAALVLIVITSVDNSMPKLSEPKRFGIYLIILAFFVIILETVVINLGIRSYAPETMEVVIGYLPLGAPIGILYYVPVFMALVISFYKYWSFMIDERLIAPVKKRRWLQSLAISIIGVLLFEVMVEPMVVNANLPSWSYLYRDVSLLITGGWVIIVWLSINFIDKMLIHRNQVNRYLGYLAAIFVVTLPIESLLMINGFRVYGPSATAAFSGFLIPFTEIPVEVAFAIPFYFGLIVAFIKYWEIVLFNRRQS